MVYSGSVTSGVRGKGVAVWGAGRYASMYIEFRTHDDVAWDCDKWGMAKWRIFIRLKAQSIFRVASALRLGRLPKPDLFERLEVPAKPHSPDHASDARASRLI